MPLFRSTRELREDPDYDFMVGQLMGVNIMLSRYLALHGDEKGKAMAQQADKTLSFFRKDQSKDPWEAGPQ
jgi:hypothetical protein